MTTVFHYMPNFDSYILISVVRTKTLSISKFLVLVSCLAFRFSFSLVDDNSEHFRHFRHRCRQNTAFRHTTSFNEVVFFCDHLFHSYA